MTVVRLSIRPKLVRFVMVVAVPVGLLLAGCSAAVDEGALAKPTPISAYAAEMMAQGYVELVGDDLAAVPLPPEPSQADLGREVYRQICLACHGDWGQGLTDAWREEWEEDSNCWQSRCHAPNHPPQGFQLPKTVPPVLGPGSLSRFDTARDLQLTILDTMPWWNPGSLTDEQSWQLTAYLMSVRGELGHDVSLDEGNAVVYRLRSSYSPPPNPYPGILLMMFSLTVAAVLLIRWRFGP